MTKLFEYPERKFRLWVYAPSFSRLLLRSGKETSGTTTIDIAFGDVDWINLPIIMTGLIIERPTATKMRQILTSEAARELNPNKIMTVYGSNYEGYISAGLMESDENDLWFRERDKWGIAPP